MTTTETVAVSDVVRVIRQAASRWQAAAKDAMDDTHKAAGYGFVRCRIDRAVELEAMATALDLMAGAIESPEWRAKHMRRAKKTRTP